MSANDVERSRWNDPGWAQTWRRRELLTSSVTGHLIEHLAPTPGQRVLEVGPGTGAATLSIAGHVAPGTVVGVDISAPMVDLATRRAREAGAGNVSFVVADAQEDDVDGGPFDAVVSQFGVMFFADPVRAFTRLRAHTLDGGRLAFACWREPQHNPWFPGPAIAPFLPAPVAPAGDRPAGLFSLAHAEATAAILSRSGWDDVRRHPYDVVVPLERAVLTDADQLRKLGLADEDVDNALAAIDERLAPLARPDGRYDTPLGFQVFTATA